MPPVERKIGFRVEYPETGGSSNKKGKGELVVIDRQEHERFVRTIFEAFGDRETRLPAASAEGKDGQRPAR